MKSAIVLSTAVWLGAIALLGACTPKYASPTSGPTAKLRFTANTQDATILRRYDVAACPATPPSTVVAATGKSSILDLGEVSSIQMIRTSGAKELLIRERLIEANQPFVFSAGSSRAAAGGARGYRCKVSGSFVPQPSNQYEIQYTFSEDKGFCQVSAYQLSMDGDGKAKRKLDRTQRYARAAKDDDYCQTALASPSRTVMGEEILSAFESTESEPTPAPPADDARETASPAAVAAAAPATAGATWIRIGDRWKYRLNHAGRGVGTVNVEIRDVNGNRVTEQITFEGFNGFRAERDVETKFEPTRFQNAVVFPGGYQLAEIAPYFPPGTELKAGQQWSQIPGEFTIQPIGKRALLSNAKVVGKDTVNVPAGQFDAWRMESASESANYNGNPVSIVCTFWYAPGIPRAVRVSVTTKSNYAVGTITETYDLAAFERGP